MSTQPTPTPAVEGDVLGLLTPEAPAPGATAPTPAAAAPPPAAPAPAPAPSPTPPPAAPWLTPEQLARFPEMARFASLDDALAAAAGHAQLLGQYEEAGLDPAAVLQDLLAPEPGTQTATTAAPGIAPNEAESLDADLADPSRFIDRFTTDPRGTVYHLIDQRMQEGFAGLMQRWTAGAEVGKEIWEAVKSKHPDAAQYDRQMAELIMKAPQLLSIYPKEELGERLYAMVTSGTTAAAAASAAASQAAEAARVAAIDAMRGTVGESGRAGGAPPGTPTGAGAGVVDELLGSGPPSVTLRPL